MSPDTFTFVISVFPAGRSPDSFTLSLHDALPISLILGQGGVFERLSGPLSENRARFAAVEVGPRGRTIFWRVGEDIVDLCARTRTRLNHTDMPIAYAVSCCA